MPGTHIDGGPSPAHTAAAIAQQLDAAAQALQHSNGAFLEGEYPLMRALVEKSIGHLKAANALLGDHQEPLPTTEPTTKPTKDTKGK